MKKIVKIAIAIAALIPAAASAQQMLTLKGAPASGDAQVTVGDVFDNAGALSNVVLGYRSGASVILDAGTVQSVVGANGGYWGNPRGQRRIVVTATNAGARTAPVAAAPAINQPPNPFGPEAAPRPAASAATPFAAIPVATVPAPRAMAARGAIVVHRTDIIEVTWSAPGVSLTMSGVAQKDAAAGDTIAVENPTSKKIIDAVITGPGHAAAGPGADQYRAQLGATQLSSR